MKKKTKKTIISLLIFIGCILLNYVLTDIGFKKESMFVSGIPYWLGSIIFSILLPVCVYISLNDKKK